MPTQLTEKEVLQYGITTNHERMDSGELRFRLLASDGTCCIRVQATDKGTWQNSHSHATLSELCVVQTGWVVFVEYDETTGACTFEKINAGEICQSRPGVPHNMYVSANSVHYAVKHGDLSVNDWIPSTTLDQMTKHLNENDIMKLLEQ